MGVFSKRGRRSKLGASTAWRNRNGRIRLNVETLECRRLLSLSAAGAESTLVEPAVPLPATTFAAAVTEEEGPFLDSPAGDAAVASNAEATSNWQSSVFSGGALGTLDFSFFRDTDTIDPLGDPVGPNQPRYAEERLAVLSNPWSVAVPGTSNIQILGSGWDHDGETPLAVVQDRRNATLIYYGGDGLEERNRVRYVINGMKDLLVGTVPGFRYLPRSAIVHEGLIVFEAQRERLEDNTWIVEGVSFVYTQDYGETLQRVPQVGGGFDVPAIAGGVADGISRGRRWAFANAFPEKSTDDPLGVWFPWTDYLYKAGGPKGGQVGLFRARRSALGEPWVVEPNKLIYERWEPGDSGGFHAHSAGMLPDGMTSFWGDVGYRNMMVRHVASDLENYTGDVWTDVEQFQGAWSPDDAKVFDLGNQAASTAPGPEFGEILTTGDLQPELVMKIEQPNDPNGKARVSRLVGSVVGTSAGSVFQGRLSLSIHRLRDRGYVVEESNVSGMGGLSTIYYSADGIRWTSIPAASGGTPFLYGDRLMQIAGGSIMVADRPSDEFWIRPLLVSPGGTNLSNDRWDESVAPADGFSYRAVVVQDGVFSYTDDGTLLDPQPESLPPVMDRMPIWEVTTDGTTTDGGRRVLSDMESDLSKHHWLTTWSYSLDGDGIEPQYKFGVSGAGGQVSGSATRWVTNTEWVPGFASGVPDPDATSSSSSLLWVFDGAEPAPRRWLTVGEGFVQGDAPTYPLQPGATGSDELAFIDGFSTGPEWTVALSFGLPRVSAFSSHFDTSGADTIRPIATILENQNNRAEVYYTRANETLWFDVYTNGFLTQKLIFPNVYLDIQDRVGLVIASSEEEFSATLQIVRDSSPITHQVQTSNGSFRPRNIFLSNITGVGVAPMEWYAVQVNASEALDAQQREQFVASDQMFRVLDVKGRLGDLDLNGSVDFDDIGAIVLGLTEPERYYRTMTVSPLINGDTDRDGDFDFDDVGTIVNIIADPLGMRPGDMDFDGDVDFDDIAAFVLGLSNADAYVEQFGFPTRLHGDMDGDRDFDFDDIPGFVQLLIGTELTAEASGPGVDVQNVGEPGPSPTRLVSGSTGPDVWENTEETRGESSSAGPRVDPIARRGLAPLSFDGWFLPRAGDRGASEPVRTTGTEVAARLDGPPPDAVRTARMHRTAGAQELDRFDRLRSLFVASEKTSRQATEIEREAVWGGPMRWWDRVGSVLPEIWLD